MKFVSVCLLSFALFVVGGSGQQVALKSAVPSASGFPESPDFKPQRLLSPQEAGAPDPFNNNSKPNGKVVSPTTTPTPPKGNEAVPNNNTEPAPKPAPSKASSEQLTPVNPITPGPAPSTAADTTPAAAAGSTSSAPVASPVGIADTTPVESAEAISGDTNGRVCFPADATVVLESGDVIAMENLEVGHRVQVGANQFSDVVMFTHALPHVKHTFVQLTTSSGKAIRATEGHYIYADAKLTRMGDVVRGNLLHIPASGAHEKVVDIKILSGRGLFNPQTAHGDIIVDHIRASTYTHTIPNKAAHAMLAPVRAAFEWTGLRINALEKIVW